MLKPEDAQKTQEFIRRGTDFLDLAIVEKSSRNYQGAKELAEQALCLYKKAEKLDNENDEIREALANIYEIISIMEFHLLRDSKKNHIRDIKKIVAHFNEALNYSGTNRKALLERYGHYTYTATDSNLEWAFLHTVIMSDDTNLAKEFFESGVEPTFSPYKFSKEPLLIALANRNRELATYLIDEKNVSLTRPVYTYSQKYDTRAGKLLTGPGVENKVVVSKDTLLTFLAGEGRIASIRLLLDLGGKSIINLSRYVLHRHRYYGKLHGQGSARRWLNELPVEQGMTALAIASRERKFEVRALLHEHGAKYMTTHGKMSAWKMEENLSNFRAKSFGGIFKEELSSSPQQETGGGAEDEVTPLLSRTQSAGCCSIL